MSRPLPEKTHTMRNAATAVLVAALAFAELPAAAQMPAPGPAAPPPGAVAEEDLPYTNNIVQNPGFEKSFASSVDKGWKDETWRGMDVDLENCPKNKQESAPDGKKALRFHVKKPVDYTYGELNGPYDKFRKAGNEGDGPPVGRVEQYVPVRPGARYALRFRWRSEGLYYEGAPGKNRGEVVGVFYGEWHDKRKEKIAADSSFPAPRWHKFQKDPKEPGWETYTDPNFADLASRDRPVQYFVPPPNAEYVRLVFEFHCRREKVRPEFWVDCVEFAEQPENPVFPEGKVPAKPAPAKPAPAGPAAPK